MAQPLLTPVTVGTIAAALLTGMGGYLATRKAGGAVAGGILGAGAVLGYFKIVEPGRYLLYTTLRQGDTGPAVQKLHERLIKHGFPPAATEKFGVFSAPTTAAVQLFQQARGLPATGIVDTATWSALVDRPAALHGSWTAADILRSLQKQKYTVLEDGRWNLVGVRAATGHTNRFDDELYLIRRTAKGWEQYVFPITTDPGTYYLTTPLNGTATAAVVPGQYPDSHAFGMHKGQYPALVQVGRMKVYRDGNRDMIQDYRPENVTSGVYGINIHKASSNSQTVDKWSAGCQVFARERDFTQFMDLLRQTGQKTFTYTLLTQAQLRPLLA